MDVVSNLVWSTRATVLVEALIHMCFKSASYILKSVSPSSTEKPLADTNAISVCIFLSKSAPSSPSMEADALVTIPPVRMTVTPGISFSSKARLMPLVMTVSSVKPESFMPRV